MICSSTAACQRVPDRAAFRRAPWPARARGLRSSPSNTRRTRSSGRARRAARASARRARRRPTSTLRSRARNSCSGPGVELGVDRRLEQTERLAALLVEHAARDERLGDRAPDRLQRAPAARRPSAWPARLVDRAPGRSQCRLSGLGARAHELALALLEPPGLEQVEQQRAGQAGVGVTHAELLALLVVEEQEQQFLGEQHQDRRNSGSPGSSTRSICAFWSLPA